ncbi:Protein of unknown function [Nitrosomonas sp. Nm34]|nr:Protein of unknown function [Nitrosomonas sp. Nm34]
MLLAGFGPILPGFGPKLPKCGDNEVSNLLKQILAEQIFENENERAKAVKQISINNIETIQIDERLNKNQCSAIFKWKLNDQTIKIIDALNNPSKETGRALFVGLLKNDPATNFIAHLSGKNLSDADLKELDKEYVKLSLNNDTYSTLFMAVRTNINNIFEESPVNLKNNIISLSNKKIFYTVRMSEDPDLKNKYLVEVAFPSQSIETIIQMESLKLIEADGKKTLDAIETVSELSPTPALTIDQALAVESIVTPTQKSVSPTVPATLEPIDNTPFAPSFDCTKASNGAERLICSDRDLSKLDVDLSQVYLKMRDKALDKNKFKAKQIDWIKTSRNACSDKFCMENAYTQRISELNE